MLNPGDSFGDYRVIRLLGKGGMGSVFLLENAEGVQVAAKILDPTTAVCKAFKALFPGWTVSENGGGAEYIGYYEEFKHRRNLVMTHPPREGVPVILTRTLRIPKKGATLHLEVASHDHGDFELEVHVRGKVVRRELITPERDFVDIDVDLSEYAGKSVKVEIWQVPNNWQWEMAFWSKIEVK